MSRRIGKNEPATKDVTSAGSASAGPRMDGERRMDSTVGENTDRSAAQLACGVKRCYVPWADHLTKKGTLRVALRDHRPANPGRGARGAVTFLDRAAIRRNRRGLDFFTGTRRSAAARRTGAGSFRTHTVDLSVPRADRKRVPIARVAHDPS
jgi:hypothetical protein